MRSLDHLRELLRIADEDHVARARRHRERVGERDLPGLVDEEVVERPVVRRVGEEPRRARGDVAVDDVVVVRDVLDVLALVVRLRVAAARLLLADEGRVDRVEHVVDRLVALRRDADGLAGSDERRDQPADRPRLARAGRALDDEVAAVEREHELA